MIAIDNAVELMVKTYLGLPRRVTGLAISRKEYADVSESFPALLDALEKHAATKLTGIDLAEIEWYHRLRNQLYHQGNGLTVERKKIDVYAELAKLLFKNLFGFVPAQADIAPTSTSGEFLKVWYEFERGITLAGAQHTVPGRSMRSVADAARNLELAGLISVNDVAAINNLREVRNLVAHGDPRGEERLTPSTLQTLRDLAGKFAKPLTV